jgi:hypothetical protein
MVLALLLGPPCAALATSALLLLATLVFRFGQKRAAQDAPLPADFSCLAAEAARKRPFETLLLALMTGALAEQIGRNPRR